MDNDVYNRTRKKKTSMLTSFLLNASFIVYNTWTTVLSCCALGVAKASVKTKISSKATYRSRVATKRFIDIQSGKLYADSNDFDSSNILDENKRVGWIWCSSSLSSALIYATRSLIFQQTNIGKVC